VLELDNKIDKLLANSLFYKSNLNIIKENIDLFLWILFTLKPTYGPRVRPKTPYG
jgi:hypothetical protein